MVGVRDFHPFESPQYSAGRIAPDDDFVVVYGDNYFKPAENVSKAIEFHKQKKSMATLVLHPVDDPTRFGIVKMDKDGKVVGMIEKPTLEEAEKYKRRIQYVCF